MELLTVNSGIHVRGTAYYTGREVNYFDVGFRKSPTVYRKDGTMLLWS